MPFGSPDFSDGDLSKAKPVGLPIKESPIPGDNTEYLLTQRFWMNRDAYDVAGALPLNTKHYAYPDFVLVEEGPRQEVAPCTVEFTRKYAKIPATHFDWPQVNYAFIGLTVAIPPGADNPTLVTRNRESFSVTAQDRHDYFLIPNPGTPAISTTDPITGDQYDVSVPGDIGQILDMQYVSQGVISGATLGGIMLRTQFLNLAASALPTWPTSEQYQAMIADALHNGWSKATVTIVKLFTDNTLNGPPATSGHMAGAVDVANSPQGGIIPILPSTLERWQGNIYRRTTRYALAQ